MGYDVWVGDDPRPGSITYNVDPMFARALGASEFIRNGYDLLILRKRPTLKRFEGRRGDDCVAYLRAAVRSMEREPEVYRAMNPENGWGNYEYALEYMRDFLAACIENPAGSIVKMHL